MDAFWLAASIVLGIIAFALIIKIAITPGYREEHPNPEYEKFLEEEFGPRPGKKDD